MTEDALSVLKDFMKYPDDYCKKYPFIPMKLYNSIEVAIKTLEKTQDTTPSPITANPKPINQLQKEIHENAIMHGWWEEEREFGTLIALCHSELSEALEEIRNGHKINETYLGENGKLEGVPSELADVVIRIMDMSEKYGIDLQTIIEQKHEYNKSRPYKHGGKEF